MRVLALVTALACLAGALAGGAAARRPATKSELSKMMSPWGWGSGGNPAAVWISSNGKRGIVLVYSASLTTAVLEAEARAAHPNASGVVAVAVSGYVFVPSPALIPRGAKPLAAFLISRVPFAGQTGWWVQGDPRIFVRGRKVNGARLREFCAEVRHQARDLVPSACR
jgi:hypothetical protein